MLRFLTVIVFILGLLASAPAFAEFARGKEAYDRQDWPMAILNLRTAGEAGDARALVLLGNMYLDGLGVIKSSTAAFTAYRRAALLGNTDGMFATAIMYQNGEGITRDAKNAIGWLRRAAELGHANAMFFYAVQLFEGSKGPAFDVRPNLPEAYFWFRLAASAMSDKAEYKKFAVVAADKIKNEIPAADADREEKRLKAWRPSQLADYSYPPDEAKQ